MPRCGTNFLYNLLLLHPSCAPPDPIWEDFLLAHSDLLGAYSDAVAAHWERSWGADENTRRHLETSLGRGLVSFLSERSPGLCVVTKTPRVDNLGQFFRFFPDAKLLILVRDGRAVIESGVRSFGWHREAAMHSLASSAETISRFIGKYEQRAEQFRLLHYEDLWQDTESQMTNILQFLDLNASDYDFARAARLPVRGSSDLAAEDGAPVHWDPVERTEAFDPMSRFSHWSRTRRCRYNQVAGPAMEALGYEINHADSDSLPCRLLGFALDVVWRIKSWIRPAYLSMVSVNGRTTSLM